MPEHHQLHDCVKAGGVHSPCLFLSLQFFNNQDGFTEDCTDIKLTLCTVVHFDTVACLFDIKLVLCTVACLFSLYALLYDYFIAPMPDSWPVLLVCSVRPALSSVCACVCVLCVVCVCVCVCAPRVHVKGRLNVYLVLCCFVVCSFVMIGVLTLFTKKLSNTSTQPRRGERKEE